MNHPRPRLSYLAARTTIQGFTLVLISLLSASSLFAQAGSPWENAANLLQTWFTGPLARALSLIAIVIGGLMFAFSEGGSKKVFAGIVYRLFFLNPQLQRCSEEPKSISLPDQRSRIARGPSSSILRSGNT